MIFMTLGKPEILQDIDNINNEIVTIETNINNINADIDNLQSTVATHTSQLEEKANKIQENWISPTLLNGTINQDVNNFNLASYRKNNFGIVNLKGVIQVTGTSTIIFILPVGYRPDRIYYFPVMCAGPTLGQMTVKATGEVIFIGGVFSYIDLSTINFEAVQ